MKIWLALVDRTAVLFLGVAVGVAVGLAFAGDRAAAPPPPPLIPQDVTPPPPTQPAAPANTAPPPTARDDATAATDAPAPVTAAPIQEAVAAPATPRLIETLRTGGPVRIGVYGDSFGDGVWSGLNRELPEKRGYDVIKYSQQATGFTRYKSLNLEEHVGQQVAAAPVDIAVVSYGANDTQGVIADGHLATYMTPAWQRLIGQRAAGLVARLRAAGATVYWVGLPRMRKPAFDADITAMNAFYAQLMRQLGVPFIDTRPMSSGPDGFAAYLPDSTGKPMLMRAEDGIHMSMNGYVRITRGLAQRIDAQVAAARTAAGIPAPVPAPPPAPTRAGA